MDTTAELGIAAKIHDDMTGKPNTMADAIRRGIAEIERLRASLESSREVNAKLCQRRDEMDAEIARLNDCLRYEQHRAEHIGTHGPGCYTWGPRHYECAMREIESMRDRMEKED